MVLLLPFYFSLSLGEYFLSLSLYFGLLVLPLALSENQALLVIYCLFFVLLQCNAVSYNMTLVGEVLVQSWVMVLWHHCIIYSYGYPIVFLVIYSLLYKNINLPKPL